MRMAKKRRLKFRKWYIPLILLVAVLAYLLLAYNYFYFRLHSAHIPWPSNNIVYNFNAAAVPQTKYVALGDSLTYGFGAVNYEDSYTYRLASSLSANGSGLTLSDLSYPGSRTDDVIKQLSAVKSIQPDVLTLFIGVNDVHQVFETSNFAENYEHILYRLTHETKAKIYVVNIPYLGPSSVNWPPFNSYYDAHTRSHNATIEKLAAKYGVAYIDLYSKTVDLFKHDGAHYAKDAYHPSAEGYKIWANILTDGIHQ